MAQPVKQDRRHSPRLEYDATTTRRFGQFVGDSLRTRLRLALANHHAFAVENANMRLVHRGEDGYCGWSFRVGHSLAAVISEYIWCFQADALDAAWEELVELAGQRERAMR